jgi:hypothetical protein
MKYSFIESMSSWTVHDAFGVAMDKYQGALEGTFRNAKDTNGDKKYTYFSSSRYRMFERRITILCFQFMTINP